MKADLRREISDRAAELAVDQVQKWCRDCECEPFPEELLALQHDLEDVLYRELARVKG